jgi:hypothetical protein
MDVDHQKTGRKILGLRNRKGVGLSIPNEITTILEVATQAEGEAWAEAKTYISVACTMREIHSIEQEIAPSS